MNYEKNAMEFAKKNGITLEILDEDFGLYFPEDKQSRSIFKCRLKRRGKQYTFKFGQSIVNAGIEPDMYDILSCMTKYDPGTLEDFISEFGYSHPENYKGLDSDEIKSKMSETYRTYKAVCKEYKAMQRLMGDLLKDEEFLDIS